jgi:hypothetical protein
MQGEEVMHVSELRSACYGLLLPVALLLDDLMREGAASNTVL